MQEAATAFPGYFIQIKYPQYRNKKVKGELIFLPTAIQGLIRDPREMWIKMSMYVTRVPGHSWFPSNQPIYTLFAVPCAYVLRAADTWLGYISALVTKRHEPRGGNHGSRDFCQRCSPVIAEELSCNLKHISEQILFQPRVEMTVHFRQTPVITSWGSFKWTWIWPRK